MNEQNIEYLVVIAKNQKGFLKFVSHKDGVLLKNKNQREIEWRAIKTI